MDNINAFDMRLRRKYIVVVVFSSAFALFVIWKLYQIQTDMKDLYCAKVLIQNKELLHLSHYQLTLLEHMYKENINRSLPIIYAITPTYYRLVQKAELTRLSQVLRLVENFHWIIVEDSDTKTDLVTGLLNESHLLYTHLAAKTPPFEKLKDKDPRWKKHRGVEQRNTGLKWLRENLELNKDRGIVYFLDDDNTYSVKLFEEMRKIKKVGVWPVGLVGGFNAEAPEIDPKTVRESKRPYISIDATPVGMIRCVKRLGGRIRMAAGYTSETNNHRGKVIGYKTGWRSDRPFAIDMAGFGINLDLILSKHDAQFSYKMAKGFQESEFLSYFITKDELEPLADNCTKVYVWHTRTETPSVKGYIPGLVV